MATQMPKTGDVRIPRSSESRTAATAGAEPRATATPSEWSPNFSTACSSETGTLRGIDEQGQVLFQPDGSSDDPSAVEIGVDISDEELIEAVRVGRSAIVLWVGAEPRRRVLVALIRERRGGVSNQVPTRKPEVTVDGESVTLTAHKQIELRCGDSSLLLQADGKIVLSGNYVVSRSRGPNKIKGATIALN